MTPKEPKALDRAIEEFSYGLGKVNRNTLLRLLRAAKKDRERLAFVRRETPVSIMLGDYPELYEDFVNGRKTWEQAVDAAMKKDAGRGKS